SLLTEDQVAAIREHAVKCLDEPQSIPAHERHFLAGPTQVLLDHPAIVGVLNEIIAHARVASEETYGFRFDHGFTMRRAAGEEHNPFNPHGGGLHALVGNSHIYQHQWGRISAGLTRVVCELTGVEEDDGATLLLSGSHKAAFPRPQALTDINSKLWESYTCPPGSVLIFTEALCHSGRPWTNHAQPRLAMFNCYNAICAKWAPHGVPDEVIDAMHPKRQSLFRGVWTGAGEGKAVNTYLDQQNRAL
ncbi:MAG: hypothetical protein CMJ49_08205, partial [Planctomycetaceae bacterium]|nr:hypothetical protein [Planctomycetaceae bacterium]